MRGTRIPGSETARFRENRYANHGQGQAVHVSPLPAEIVEPFSLSAGTAALDLACGGGADSLGLTHRGWQVVAVDIAAGAGVARRAEIEGLAGQVRVEAQDLSRSVPDEAYGELRLDEAGWIPVRWDCPQRKATGTNGETAIVTDHALLVQSTLAGDVL
ncbi:hypothetical protein [Amycolatopsis pigmentata]|uniref:Methyltransferase domain-containing protein n=1 Tax=Amycolatopsis pigmentata TaxID=450801 RepID=A0ABW5FJI9_9PSEU